MFVIFLYYLYAYVPLVTWLQMDLDQLQIVHFSVAKYIYMQKDMLRVGDPGSVADFRANVQGKGGKGRGLFRPGLLSLQITPNGSP